MLFLVAKKFDMYYKLVSLFIPFFGEILYIYLMQLV